jgi:hypothetical protein
LAWGFHPRRRVFQAFLSMHVSAPVDAFRTTLERLATYTRYDRNHPDNNVLIFIDTGYGDQFRGTVRRMRRYHQVGSLRGGSLSAAAPMILEDPIPRDSKHSPFVQMADLCAYAAMRQLSPRSGLPDLWNDIGPGIVRDVNKHQRLKEPNPPPPGIKAIPV